MERRLDARPMVHQAGSGDVFQLNDRRHTVSTPVDMLMCRSPPSYPANSSEAVRPVEPPSYNVAVELPTYEEYQRSKQEEEEENARLPLPNNQTTEDSYQNVDRVIGTDSMFVLGFVFAFLFNWLGLLVSFCLMHTCAGRFGALAGFGMSMIKWVLIVKSNKWATGVAQQDSWLWWIMMTFGIMIASSGFLQYIRIKYLWSRRRGSYI